MNRYLTACLLATACSEAVDYELDPAYTSWDQWTVCGYAPGHGDSCRVIYVNDAARGAWDGLGYPMGSDIVKEIRANDDGTPGGLEYLAVMRRTEPIDAALEEEGGWLFAQLDAPDAQPVYRSLCWGRCHVAAPYNGAFYDYRR